MTSPRYRIELAPAAARQLDRLPPGDAAALRGPILGLAQDPRPRGATTVGGTEFVRIRVGQLRMIYVVDDPAHLVIVLRVARRSESTYRRVR